MLRNRAILEGYGALHDGPPKSKVSLEIQGFAPPSRRRRTCGLATQRARDVAGAEPIVSGMAGRYANALFELALEAKAVDAVKADLDAFDAMIVESDDLRRLVRSPVFGAEERTKALVAVIERAGIKGLAANFLRLVASNRRLFAVRDMIKSLRTLVARWKGEVAAEVTVAEKLSDHHLDALKAALKSVTGGKAVDLNVKVDPAIIGGLTVKLGSRMVDSSLRTKLNAIKHAMKEAG
jgi:F-type H+-transporting ATPase subunit delta